MPIYFGRTELLEKIGDAVHLYGDEEFKSPTRSTIPMLSLLIHDLTSFHDILTQIGFPPDYDDLFLEYTVSPRQGRGKASHSDVMLKKGQRSLAIEAKWTEPLYKTVTTWLAAGPNLANRTAVLNGWLGPLNNHATAPVLPTQCGDLIYQMVHRAASAAEAGSRPSLVYFLFEPSPDLRAATPGDILDKLTELWETLGRPADFDFHVVQIEAITTEAYGPLGQLPHNDEATAESVSEALQGGARLFTFGQVTHHVVGAEA